MQLHPRDCRAAFIEFNHTDGSDDILGPYPPAGPDWQQSINRDVTQALVGIEMQSPEPRALADHWGRIIGIAVTGNQRNEPELKLPNAEFHFVKGSSDLMSGLTFRFDVQRCAMPPQAIWRLERLARLVLRGNLRLRRPIAFSTPPFCQGEWKSQK